MMKNTNFYETNILRISFNRMSIANFKPLSNVQMKKIMAGYGQTCCDEKPCQGKSPQAICSKNGFSGHCTLAWCSGSNCNYQYYDCL